MIAPDLTIYNDNAQDLVFTATNNLTKAVDANGSMSIVLSNHEGTTVLSGPCVSNHNGTYTYHIGSSFHQETRSDYRLVINFIDSDGEGSDKFKRVAVADNA